MRDYDVAEFDDGQGGKGILVTHCFAWQPQTNSLAHGGSEVFARGQREIGVVGPLLEDEAAAPHKDFWRSLK